MASEMVRVSDPWGAFGSGMLPAKVPETWMVLLRVFTLEVLPALPAVDCCASTLPAFCGRGTCWALGVDGAASWATLSRHTNPPVITRLSKSNCFLGRVVFISARSLRGRVLAGSVLAQHKGA